MDRLHMLSDKDDSTKRHVRREVKQPKVKAASVPRTQRFCYLDSIMAYLLDNPKLRAKYLSKIADDRLSAIDREIKRLMLSSNLQGDGLVDQVTATMEQPDVDVDVDLLDQVRSKMVQLQMINEQAKTAIEGVKSESDLLDYLCHYEQDYCLKLSKELMVKSLNANQTVSDSEVAELARQSRAARKMAEQLDPSRNRRNGYQGLRSYYNLW